VNYVGLLIHQRDRSKQWNSFEVLPVTNSFVAKHLVRKVVINCGNVALNAGNAPWDKYNENKFM
jgi:hypothetical protein